MTRTVGQGAVDTVVDSGRLPDAVLRRAIRTLLGRRLRATTSGGVEARDARKRALIETLASSPVTIEADEANAQHYEVPTELFELMLGPHLKYSSGYWPAGVTSLAEAEEAMLRLTCARADLADGQDVLELGCGWGSLTLFMAQQYPSSRITAVSNSSTQREYILKQAAMRGLDNLTVLTCDVARLGEDGVHADVVHADAFDRVVSVEMFEHVRNHRELTRRIAGWLRERGKLFVHVFAHTSDPYPFATGSRADWMARHFFSGGIMPSHDLLVMSVVDLAVEDRWAVSGLHYARTLHAWLDRLDAHRDRILQLFAERPDGVSAQASLHRWRVFTIACEELFAYRGGDEWHVSHVRFVKPS